MKDIKAIIASHNEVLRVCYLPLAVEILREIRIRRTLIGQMVGQLYPSIVAGEIQELQQRLELFPPDVQREAAEQEHKEFSRGTQAKWLQCSGCHHTGPCQCDRCPECGYGIGKRA